jgi:hypothetical protein
LDLLYFLEYIYIVNIKRNSKIKRKRKKTETLAAVLAH